MDRNQILMLLNTLDTPALIRALSMNGIAVQAPQGDEELMSQLSMGDEQEKWNDIRVNLDKPVKPPIHSPEAVFRMMPPARQELARMFPVSGMPEEEME